MDFVAFGIILFILIQLSIGFVVSKFVKTEDDYLLAGRRLGIPLATFSIFATWFGAESCIGSAGTAYDEGLAGVSSDPFGYGLCILLVGFFFARKFWEMKLVTVADFIRYRYSARAAQVCALLMIPTSFLWTAAQIRAFATILSTSSDISLTAAIVVSTSIVILYTSFGGMLADVLTDFLQGSILIVGLGLMMYFIIDAAGGIEFFAGSVMNGISQHSSIRSTSILETAEHWLIPICGSLFAQELISRVLSSHSSKVAARSALIAGSMYILIGLIPLTLGLAGSLLVPGLTDGEQILPELAKKYLPSAMYIVFVGAIISAILSTVDSTLLAISALISHNIFPMSKNLSEKKKVMIDRSIVIMGGFTASFLALGAEGVYELVKDASAFGSAGIFIVIIAGLYSQYGHERTAIATLAAGTLSWIIAYYFYKFDYSYILSLTVSIIVFLIFSFPQNRTHAARNITSYLS